MALPCATPLHRKKRRQLPLPVAKAPHQLQLLPAAKVPDLKSQRPSSQASQ
jgi:hypothetical protein